VSLENANSQSTIIKSFAVWDYPLTDTFSILHNTMKLNGWMRTLDEGIDHVIESDSKEQFALVIDYADGKYIESNYCTVKMTESRLAQRAYSFGFAKNTTQLRVAFDEM